MNEDEARSLLARRLRFLLMLPYEELVERFLDRIETSEALGPSGTRYRVELSGRWEDPAARRLRIRGSIEDGEGGRVVARFWAAPGDLEP